MTYRCIHCVYHDVVNTETGEIKCLKHNDEIKSSTDEHCDDLILTPINLLSHIEYWDTRDTFGEKYADWGKCDKHSYEQLRNYGFAGMTVETKGTSFKERIYNATIGTYLKE